MKAGYVLTNYTVQCADQISGKTGCFLFDLNKYEKTGKFYAISPVYKDLDDLYKNTNRDDRKPCYVEYQANDN
jgi:hypothetical protein